jgi:hypothetical protein
MLPETNLIKKTHWVWVVMLALSPLTYAEKIPPAYEAEAPWSRGGRKGYKQIEHSDLLRLHLPFIPFITIALSLLHFFSALVCCLDY